MGNGSMSTTPSTKGGATRRLVADTYAEAWKQDPDYRCEWHGMTREVQSRCPMVLT